MYQMVAAVVVVATIATIAGCGAGPEQEAARRYLEHERTSSPALRDDVTAADLATPRFNDRFSRPREPWEERAAALTTFRVVSSTVDGDSAVVAIEAMVPDTTTAPKRTSYVRPADVVAAIESGGDPDAGERAYKKALDEWYAQKQVPMMIKTGELKLRKESGDWKVFLDLQTKVDEIRRSRMERESTAAGIVVEGATLDEKYADFCRKMAARLPARGESRAVELEGHIKYRECPDPGPPTVSELGYWNVKTTQRKIDDSADVLLLLKDVDEPGATELFARCSQAKLQVLISGSRWRPDDSTTMKLRVDKQQATTWPVRNAIGRSTSVENPRDWLRAVKDAKTIVVASGTSEAEFPIDGLKAALKAMPKECAP